MPLQWARAVHHERAIGFEGHQVRVDERSEASWLGGIVGQRLFGWREPQSDVQRRSSSRLLCPIRLASSLSRMLRAGRGSKNRQRPPVRECEGACEWSLCQRLARMRATSSGWSRRLHHLHQASVRLLACYLKLDGRLTAMPDRATHIDTVDGLVDHRRELSFNHAEPSLCSVARQMHVRHSSSLMLRCMRAYAAGEQQMASCCFELFFPRASSTTNFHCHTAFTTAEGRRPPDHSIALARCCSNPPTASWASHAPSCDCFSTSNVVSPRRPSRLRSTFPTASYTRLDIAGQSWRSAAVCIQRSTTVGGAPPTSAGDVTEE